MCAHYNTYTQPKLSIEIQSHNLYLIKSFRSLTFGTLCIAYVQKEKKGITILSHHMQPCESSSQQQHFLVFPFMVISCIFFC